MGVTLDMSLFINSAEPLSFPSLGVYDAVIKVGNQKMSAPSAKLKLRVLVVRFCILSLS